jgi:succinoglycan biosynthesis protein ExoV
MKLTFFQTKVPNFGDELNAVLWPHLLPSNFLDEGEDELFVGIGSILFDNYPRQARKIVVGSGFAGYTAAPDLHDGSWEVLWVRGPITAQKLGLDTRLAITDSAVLLRAMPLPEPEPGLNVAFMPHVDSLSRSRWADVCALAGVAFVDPRDPVEAVISRIRGARLLITEAMHGAIAADALRTPWIAVLPFHPTHRDKWTDWAASLDIQLRRNHLQPASMAELWAKVSGRQAVTGKSRRYLAGGPSEPINRLLRHRAAADLLRIAAKAEPQLSTDAALECATERALETLHGFLRRRGAS